MCEIEKDELPINILIIDIIITAIKANNNILPNDVKLVLVMYPYAASNPNIKADDKNTMPILPISYTKNIDDNVSPLTIEYTKNNILATNGDTFLLSALNAITTINSSIKIKVKYL